MLSEFCESMTHLRTLKLRWNLVKHVTVSNLFCVSERLSVDLRDNSLGTVDLDKIDVIHKSQDGHRNHISMDLSRNKLECDCHSHFFAKYLQERMSLQGIEFVVENVTCRDTKRLVQDTPLEQFVCPIGAPECPEDHCQCWKQPEGREIVVNCTSAEDLSELVSLHPTSLSLANASLANLTSLNITSLKAVRTLDLSGNQLSSVPVIPAGVRRLFLHSNELRNISRGTLEMFVQNNLTQLRLDQNPWQCDCGLLPLQEYLRNHYQALVNPREIHSASISVALLLAAIAIVVVGGILAVAYVKNAERVKVWIYAQNIFIINVFLFGRLDEDNDAADAYEYDAFVAFAPQDEHWVHTELLPTLEGKYGFKLCIPSRDWLGGEWIPDQVVQSVQESRRTIVVMSRSFDSGFGGQAFRTAFQESLKTKRSRHIVVILGEPPTDEDLGSELANAVKSGIHRNEKRFWDRLRYRLPHVTQRGRLRSTSTATSGGGTSDSSPASSPSPLSFASWIGRKKAPRESTMNLVMPTSTAI
ncbi:unnamed protein product [Cyprideis torosa]|uniref:Uncharacterized protein n=1 Tax=Cyprideis torosa TaxID=163714 RepID=A0A7R8WQP1_9CRUS|nr:unnamed protein product [Cyprideis torosa]CAG0901959.1 unnamed protein product [Cyprideis torosa]